jgi:hypothetical protein
MSGRLHSIKSLPYSALVFEGDSGTNVANGDGDKIIIFVDSNRHGGSGRTELDGVRQQIRQRPCEIVLDDVNFYIATGQFDRHTHNL